MSRPRSRIARSKEFVAFRSQVPKRRVNVAGKDWTFFQYGPKDVPPLICLHGTSGTAETFFCQVSTLGSKGYHIIAAQWPDYWDHGKWVAGFYKFLATLNVAKCHLLGVSLGGFMALHFAARYPDRVASMILCNSFVDTEPFHQNPTWVTMLGYMPEFYLKKYILDSFPKGALPGPHADAVDFVVEQLETLSRNDLGSRLTLNCLPSSVSKHLKKISKIPMTLLDTVDDVVLPEQMRDRLYKAFPGAKLAYIKKGGDFPFLSAHMEVSMHIQVHLRGNKVFPGGDDAKTYAKKSGIDLKDSGEATKPKIIKKKRLTEAEKKELERRRKEEERKQAELKKKLEEERKRREEEARRKAAERQQRQEAGNKILAGLGVTGDDDDEDDDKHKKGEGTAESQDLFADNPDDTGEADPFA
uniref:Maspardin n=1 Tax=Lotharella oceanica TaxID=641309 RepID=A0A7S2U516_9EUKA|mmetsp:Transcript_7823/g.15321  ORF Transcript_7823/g.15321 Transcript_7823/m.15321 type:complete len:414 (+) Transcript_7823:202-1443(+)